MNKRMEQSKPKRKKPQKMVQQVLQAIVEKQEQSQKEWLLRYSIVSDKKM